MDVGDHTPIKQHPFRVGPSKNEHLKNEIQYMFENDIIEKVSPWSSPCVLVPKANKSYRFCTDFRKVYAITKTNSYKMIALTKYDRPSLTASLISLWVTGKYH